MLIYISSTFSFLISWTSLFLALHTTLGYKMDTTAATTPAPSPFSLPTLQQPMVDPSTFYRPQQQAYDPGWFLRASSGASKHGPISAGQSMELLLLQILAQLQIQRECSAALEELTSEKRRWDAVEEQLEEHNYELRREKRQLMSLVSELQFENRQLKRGHCNGTGGLDPTVEFLKQRVKDLEESLKKEREVSADLREQREKAERQARETATKLTLCESQLSIKCVSLPQTPVHNECNNAEPCEGEGCEGTVKERFSEFLTYLNKQELGVNITIPPRNWRPLHIAAAYGQYPEVILSTLIVHGADVNATERDGETALHLATQRGKTRAVKVLLANDVNYKLRNLAGNTALHEAAWRGYLDVVQALLAISGPEYVKPNNFGNLPLHNAAWKGHAAVVRTLLNAGCDPNAVGEEGQTALHMAAKRGYLDVTRILVEAGANVVALTEDRKSVLDVAVENSHADIAQYLRGVIETLDSQGLDVRGNLS